MENTFNSLNPFIGILTLKNGFKFLPSLDKTDQ